MEATREFDWDHLMDIPKDKLINLLFLHIRDIWSVDGLYYQEIESRFGTELATEIDMDVWGVMGKIQARRLKKALNIEESNIRNLFETLKLTDWWLDMENKEYEVDDAHAKITNRECRVHLSRQKKGLSEFNCKQVRWGFLKNFVKEFNPNIEVDCHFCPMDAHPEDAWCEWEFIMK
jgi:hypothetical protein